MSQPIGFLYYTNKFGDIDGVEASRIVRISHAGPNARMIHLENGEELEAKEPYDLLEARYMVLIRLAAGDDKSAEMMQDVAEACEGIWLLSVAAQELVAKADAAPVAEAAKP